QAGDISAEILLIDDGSTENFRKLNLRLRSRQSNQGELIRYHEIGENIGRSRIRNRFTAHAQNNHLLFLDCDSGILSDKFLERYAEAIREHPDSVICGGRVYDVEPPSRNRRLHWKYGIRKESRPAGQRKEDPNRSFMTNNFLIPIHLLKEIPFDERLSGYGHEDSLFGYELFRNGREIIHIDNPVVHGDLETDREFVEKTAEAVHNLVFISKMLKDDPGFAESITLLSTVHRLESVGLAGIIRVGSILYIPLIRWLLQHGIASLKLLDAYKLGLYLRLIVKKSSPKTAP
ncbi:MAG: glycosyltransferase, partial [Bacteroidales bacterium]|nr:glycosyltransferase [Bacteroidales bacterium]